MLSWGVIAVWTERRDLMGALLALLITAPVYAQQPSTANDPGHPATVVTSPAAATPAPPAGDMRMMDMCRQMMTGDMMATPMMGAPTSADPKDKVEMLQMRGEMMKAMGDIMMKHARHMQGMTGK
jgi:hypothetical protein